MRPRLVLRLLALVSAIVSLCMLFPFALAVFDGGPELKAFAASLGCGVAISGLLFALSGAKTNYEELAIREAFVVLSLSWITATAVGALPYLFTDVVFTYTDAFFETMSGLTTTGASVLTDIEAAPRALLLWRSFTHWLGGVGIVLLSLAILPFLGVGGMELYKAEVPGAKPEKLTPRVRQTAFYLWAVYALLTVLETAMLMLGGMSFFDALNHSFSTVSTGGFSTKSASIGHFQSPYIEWTVTVFMFLAGVNFSLHFLLLSGAWRKVWRDEELKFYSQIIVFSVVLITAVLWLGRYYGRGEALRSAAFHVVSLITTTGFSASDYDLWPHFARLLLLLLMFAGGCAGSTGGGIKIMRILVLVRQILAEAKNILHPRAVLHTRVNGGIISRSSLSSVTAFFMLYMAIFIGASLAVSAFEHPKLDVLTAFSGVVACLGNVGPGLNALGPAQNYAWLPDGVKWIFAFCMLVGRLELYAVILLFLPGTWKR